MLPWSPLARGLLAAAGRADRARATDAWAEDLYDHPRDPDVVARVQEVAAARGVAPATVALAWLLGRPEVTAPIIGATRAAHVEDAVAALSLELSDDERAALEDAYVAHDVRGIEMFRPR